MPYLDALLLQGDVCHRRRQRRNDPVQGPHADGDTQALISSFGGAIDSLGPLFGISFSAGGVCPATTTTAGTFGGTTAGGSAAGTTLMPPVLGPEPESSTGSKGTCASGFAKPGGATGATAAAADGAFASEQ